MTRSITRLALGIIVSLTAASPARAANKTWFAGASGDFGNQFFWIPQGVPGTSDTATFNSVGTYTVTFAPTPPLASIVFNQDLFFNSGTVTFTSGPGFTYTYWLTGSGGDDALITGGSLTLGTSGHPLHMRVDDDLQISGGATMFAKFGSQITTKDLTLHDANALPGGLGIIGSGSSLAVTGSANLGIDGKKGFVSVYEDADADFNGTLSLGDGSDIPLSYGFLSAHDGGTITTANITIATKAINGQTGALYVGTGTGTSTVTQDTNATLIVGANLAGPNANPGYLTIFPDGVFQSGSGTGTITVNPTGTIDIIGGRLDARGNVTINDGLLRRDNSGTFNLSAGKAMTIQNGGSFEVTGPYTADNATYKVTGDGSKWTTYDSPLIIGDTGTCTVTIEAGGEVVSGGGVIGLSLNSNGAVTFTGDGSHWTNGSFLTVGSEGTGSLRIEDGGEVYNNSGTGSVGFFGSGDGTVTVTGTGSTWTTLSLNVGNDFQGGTGLVEVLLGGLVQANGNVKVYDSGSIDIQAGGTFNANGDVTIDGGVLTRAAGGAFALSAGKNFTAENNGNVSFTGSSVITGGSTYTIQSGAGLSTTSTAFGNGTLLVDGVGTTLTVSAASQLGSSGLIGTITVRNGATADFNGVLGLADTSTSHFSGGVLNVESGATITTANIRIAPNSTNGQTGTFTVGNGVGTSMVTQDANATLVVGGNPTAGPVPNVGTLNINSGGVFDSGTGTGNITINPTGTLNVASGGTLNAKGNITIDDGVLTRGPAGTFSLTAGKTMTAQNGGTASFSGSYSTATDAIYNITGVGSRLEAVAGGTLSIINGGQVNVSSGGSLFAATTIQIGFSNATDGTLIVDGAGSSATTPGAGASIWGFGGSTAIVAFQNNASGSFSQVSLAHSTTAGTTAIVDVQSGADLTFTSNLFLASLGGATTSASLFVEGSGSTVTQTGGSTLTVGHSASGTAAIDIGTAVSGAVFDTGTGLTTINKTGTVTIGSASTSGTLKADGNVTINGGILTRSRNSSFNLADGKTMTIQNGGHATFNDDYTTATNATYNVNGANSRMEVLVDLNFIAALKLNNGAQMNVGSGGIVSVNGLDIGTDGTVGTLMIDGGTSSVVVAGTTSNWGAGGGTANVTFKNGAISTFRNIALTAGTTAGTSSTVNVLSGAHLNLDHMSLAISGGAIVGATLNVNGGGSTVTQNGPSTLTIGHASAGLAAINIGTTNSGGTFSTGTGATTINKTGTVNIGSGTNLGTLNANGNVTIDGGLMQVGFGSSVVASGKTITLSNAGTLKGSGNVTGTVLNTSGIVEPGSSAGTLSISDSYTQAAAGQLLIEMTSATSFDVLAVTGNVSLAGTLDVDLLGGFVPQPGSVFPIISATGGVSGTFGTVLLPTLTGANWQLLYGTNSVLLRVALLGDYNFNGTVDGGDYVIWRKTLNQTGAFLLADGNANGQIDTGDYNVWRSHFGLSFPGAGSGSAGGSPSQTAVPEPTTFVLVCGCVASGWCLLIRGRRQTIHSSTNH
jgi:T5SS/PEP-CTERM-associated repeat protein